MARASTTADVFNAIAEPRRREIIDALQGGRSLSVGELVERLGLAQSAVSKHLGVLRRVGVVTVTKDGQHRYYRLKAEELKVIHDWVQRFEKHWDHQLTRVKDRAEKSSRKSTD